MFHSLRPTLAASCFLFLLAAASADPLLSPVRLPDGKEFTSWEVPLQFTRTYFVNPRHPQAADQNPGTEDRPFRTIGRAAQVLEPGERVVIAAGIYRERVAPARGGSGPDRMISYEAAPEAEVTLSGSRELSAAWKPSERDGQRGAAAVWMTTLQREWFEDENPFAELNLTDAQIDRGMPWAVPIKGKPTLARRRGLVFQDGQRLRQVDAYQDLAKTAGTYCLEADGLTLHVHPLGDADPNQAHFEVTTRGMIFAPRAFGLGYIRVKGLTIQHAGNCFPRPQQGALSTMRGHHWLIEANAIRQCNAIGIDIGDQFDTSGPDLAEGGRHIVRRNRISDCGIGGIEGKQIEHTRIEDNVIRRCGWHDIWPLYETGGIKVHCTHSCLLRRNLVADTVGAPGIWMDYTNVNSRCTANVIVNAQCDTGGIFMEASQQPNSVDNNVVWGTRGNGIYQHDCDELTIAHNLIAHSSGAAVRMQICQGRMVAGRLSTAKRNRILNNILIANGQMFAISDPDNVCDWNVLAGSKKPFDLDARRRSHGWDQHSVTAEIPAALHAETLEFTWPTGVALPQVPRLDTVPADIFGEPRGGALLLPGPFASLPLGRVQLLPPVR